MLRRVGLPVFVAAAGWVMLVSYLMYDNATHSGDLLAHLLKTDSAVEVLFHSLMVLAPLASTAFALALRERNMLIDSLREVDTRYRDYYDNAPHGYHSAGPDLVLIEVNRTWLRMLGYNSRSEVVGRLTVGDIAAPEARDALMRAYERFREAGELMDFETVFRRADGSNLHVMLSASAMRDAQGNIVRSRTIVQDITERLAFEDALREVAGEWESTFSSMPWGVLIVDEGCRVIRANEFFAAEGIDAARVADEQCRALIGRMLNEHSGVPTLEFTGAGDRRFRLAGRRAEGESMRFVFTLLEITDIRKGERKLIESRNAFFNMLKDINETYKELERVHTGMIYAFANAIDAKSPWTKGHSERVTQYADAIAAAMGIETRQRSTLKTAALLHDIGKIGTYDYLLEKPESLTEDEYEVVKRHPELSAQILGPVASFSQIKEIVLHHHEKFDGTGYPMKLKGEDIPLLARILAIADAYDSMTADRPYRSAPGKDYAIEELRSCSGTHFDPAITDLFINLLKENKI